MRRAALFLAGAAAGIAIAYYAAWAAVWRHFTRSNP